MDIRLDTPFESWGGFCMEPPASEMIHGRLRYTPDEGIHLELGQDPRRVSGKRISLDAAVGNIYGKLVNGVDVTLEDCYVTTSMMQLGFGVSSPTTVRAGKALFGRQVHDISGMNVSRYAVELSSLANWTCTPPVRCDVAEEQDSFVGYDVRYRRLEPIRISLPDKPFDIEIREASTADESDSTFSIKVQAFFIILARDEITFDAAHQAAWQFQNLLSLLIGDRLGVKSTQIWPAQEVNDDSRSRACHFLYNQRGRHDEPAKHAPEMLLPYSAVTETFGSMVQRWFARSEQALLATNLYFGSLISDPPTVDVRFLSTLQAAESYHRSLGTGFFMDEDAYRQAVHAFLTHLPAEIQGDHRQNLKNRLKYGNEFSLRKRLTEMFHRLPLDLQVRIAGDVNRFVTRVVDTRNYYTHYDSASMGKALQGKDAYVASERVRALTVANLLLDLGMPETDLATALLRSRRFSHWMFEKLPL